MGYSVKRIKRLFNLKKKKKSPLVWKTNGCKDPQVHLLLLFPALSPFSSSSSTLNSVLHAPLSPPPDCPLSLPLSLSGEAGPFTHSIVDSCQNVALCIEINTPWHHVTTGNLLGSADSIEFCTLPKIPNHFFVLKQWLPRFSSHSPPL